MCLGVYVAEILMMGVLGFCSADEKMNYQSRRRSSCHLPRGYNRSKAHWKKLARVFFFRTSPLKVQNSDVSPTISFRVLIPLIPKEICSREEDAGEKKQETLKGPNTRCKRAVAAADLYGVEYGNE